MSANSADRSERNGSTGARASGELQGSPQLGEVLREHLIGMYDIPVSSIACAAVVREVNQRGVRRVVESIRAKGWVPSTPPSVVACQDIDMGQALSPADARKLTYRILDGNHRVTAFREVYGRQAEVRCNVYRSFPAGVSRAIADCEYLHVRRDHGAVMSNESESRRVLSLSAPRNLHMSLLESQSM